MSSINGNQVFKTISANDTYIIPPNCAIAAICVKNNTANAVTGGIKIGTTNGGSEVLSACAISGNFMDVIEPQLGKRWFSTTDETMLYVQAVTGWNGAQLELTVCLINLS